MFFFFSRSGLRDAHERDDVVLLHGQRHGDAPGLWGTFSFLSLLRFASRCAHGSGQLSAGSMCALYLFSGANVNTPGERNLAEKIKDLIAASFVAARYGVALVGTFCMAIFNEVCACRSREKNFSRVHFCQLLVFLRRKANRKIRSDRKGLRMLALPFLYGIQVIDFTRWKCGWKKSDA